MSYVNMPIVWETVSEISKNIRMHLNNTHICAEDLSGILSTSQFTREKMEQNVGCMEVIVMKKKAPMGSERKMQKEMTEHSVQMESWRQTGHSIRLHMK